MSDQPAAIRGTFADFRLIKGRKVAQMVIELPIEEADAALATLGGLPQPASERWVAIARLNGSAEEKSPEQRRWEDLKLSMQAGIRCAEVAFWRFLSWEFPDWGPVSSEDEAAMVVRVFCKIDSRKQLNLDASAAEKWRDLEASYQAWLRAPA